MQTHFTDVQLADSATRESAGILRRCVHCGFCTATCPTYVLSGDELDSPRGRIYLIKDMLENGRPASAKVVKHIDRCLSCLSCMTTCPSDVNYAHLVDHARVHIQNTYRRPFFDRILRFALAGIVPHPRRFRLALLAGWPFRLLGRWLPGRLGVLLRMIPDYLHRPSSVDRPQVFAALGRRRKRVALLNYCAQQVLAPEINEATIRLLTRHGCEVVIAAGAACCGSLAHHMGLEHQALANARANIDAWTAEIAGPGLDAVVVNTSGCGSTIKDYGFMLREDPAYAAKAARISALSQDVTELMTELGLQPGNSSDRLRVAYHSACSLQHGQRIKSEPVDLLRAAGFNVAEIAEGHLCCGSAGTYNILQPEFAGQLRRRKLDHIDRMAPDLIAAGNIGCINQLAGRVPVVHTAELLDWATGGPKPAKLAQAPEIPRVSLGSAV